MLATLQEADEPLLMSKPPHALQLIQSPLRSYGRTETDVSDFTAEANPTSLDTETDRSWSNTNGDRGIRRGMLIDHELAKRLAL